MHAAQLIRQVAYVLNSLTWTGGNRVFGDVIPTAGLDDKAAARLKLPAALVRLGPRSAIDQHTQRWETEVEIDLIVRSSGDTRGSGALIGRVRPSSAAAHTTSLGAGLLDLDARVHEALDITGEALGLSLRFIGSSAAGSDVDGNDRRYAFMTLGFSAVTTGQRTYPAPPRLQNSGAALSWASFPDTYHRLRFILRRSNSSAPATVSDGTGVTLASDLATSVTDPDGEASYYSLFCAYDELGDGNETAYSEPRSIAT